MAYYAQLIPKEGGILKYVEYRFGNTASYFVGWIYLSLFYPVLTAVLFTVSGIYISHLFAEFMDFKPGFLHYSLIGFVNLLLLFFFNLYRPKISGVFQSTTTVIKMIPLIFIASLGIISLVKGDVDETRSFSYAAQHLQENQSLLYLTAASFIPISFAFDGWYIVTQISGEVKNSKKNLPMALVFGTVLVMIIYILYYSGIVLGMGSENIIAQKDAYITEFSRNIGSKVGAIVIQLFIIISVLGTSNGLLMATMRVPYQFAKLEKSKKFLNLYAIDHRLKMPINSAVFGLVLTFMYLLAFYFTNTQNFFTDLQFDISAIPIIFIYMVNGALFFGLFKLINQEQTLQKNKGIKRIFAVIALFGILIVLFGSATAPNGITYFTVSIFYLVIGFLFKKKE